MGSVKTALKESVTFQAIVESPTLPQFKSLFVDEAVKDLARSGKTIAEVKVMSPEEAHIAVIDGHSSMGYNVFKSGEEYDSWMKQSLHEPTQDQIEEAMNRGNGS